MATSKGHIFQKLVYVYVGTAKYGEDFDFYKRTLGARLVWEFKESGAKVAAFDLCGEPYLLLADHVEAPSKRLIYSVGDIRRATAELKARGWKQDGGSFEVPDGPCINFTDRSGNQYAIIQMTRPHVLEWESGGSG